MTNYKEDDGYGEFLQQLIDLGHLEDDKVIGITKQVIDQGEESLSEKQAYIFKTAVKAVYVTDQCATCGDSIPWSEMLEAYDNGGNCGHCAHKLEKLESE